MKGTDRSSADHSTDGLEELFRNASRRERPSRQDEDAVRQALHAQWVGMTRQRKMRRTMMLLATAASLAVVTLVGIGLFRSPAVSPPTVQLASVEKLIGVADTGTLTADSSELMKADTILGPGHRVGTRDATRLALRWVNGESIRLDENTRIQLRSRTEVELISGRIYIDTGLATKGAELQIITPGGVVRHLGTQYQVSVIDGGLAVSIRSGKVQVRSGSGVTIAEEGEQIRLDHNGVHHLESIPTYGPLWQWSEALAPVYSLEDRVLSEFLDWVAHESGYEVEYESARAEALARHTTLHGAVEMEPLKALKVMMQTTDLESEVVPGIIRIRPR